LEPIYEELGQIYADHSDRVVIAKCDIGRNNVPEDIPWVPTIVLYPAGKKDSSFEYDGDIALLDLMQFVRQYGTHRVDV
jgi:protein disulfide-isomerase A1